jgi:hypothetical protein
MPPEPRDQDSWSHTDAHTTHSEAAADFKLKRLRVNVKGGPAVRRLRSVEGARPMACHLPWQF